ncbi:MAG TPA: winged helix-turn-helix domain-containing protein [Pyrinomonadaceae bacterium]|jgi:Tol biopolymer transport system component/DNA-binding winged helix-turn-helix (wHTH) protein
MVKGIEGKRLYGFGPFLLNPSERVLTREGQPVPLTPKVFDLLLVLVENGGHLLGKRDLMEAVWPDSFVEEGNLTFTVSTLRKALGEDRKEPLYIETVPRSGYRFVADVRVLEGDPGAGAATNGVRVGDDEPVEEAPAVVAAPPRAEAKGGRRSRKLPALLAALLAAAVAAGIYAYAGRSRSGAESLNLLRGATVNRLTTTRNAVDAVISPDGKYVVYVVDEARQRSLWLRQVATNSHVQVIAPSPVLYLDMFFSRDGDYVYYVQTDGSTRPALYQIPLTGGTPRKLLENMTGPIGLSPDGRRFAAVRHEEDGAVVLTVADAFDGGNARDLVKRKRPDFLYRPVWSPDGKVVACIAVSVSPEDRYAQLVEARVEDGAERPISNERWKYAERLEWLSDGSGLLTTVSENAYGPFQIWHVSYPGGRVQKVTSDLSNYRSMSLTADSRTLVAVQSDIHPYVWVAPEGDAARARQVTSGHGASNDYWGFAWTPDGRVVYVSTLSGNQDIWVMNADGSGQKQLTFDRSADFDPTVSPDGRHVVFASERSGRNKLWRIDLDGGNPTQMTTGAAVDFLPNYSPDGRWVVYTSDDTRETGLWKIPSGGGEPSRLTNKVAVWPSVSPDSRFVACWHIDEQKKSIALAVVPIEGGEPVKSFEVSPTTNTWAEIRWTPDGRGLTYVDAPDGVGNVWLQPLAGGPPKRLTDFKSDRIFRFDWSRDGKQLVCSRGAETNDVVLIGGLR